MAMRRKLRKLFHNDDLRFVSTALRYAEDRQRHEADGQTKKTYQKCRWFADRLDSIWNRSINIWESIPHDKEINNLLDNIEFAYRIFVIHMLDYRAGQTWQEE